MRNKDDLKAIRIREMAIDLIVKHGFDGLSMQKLAKAVSISVSTIYVYYENREDMLNKIYLEADEIFMEEILKKFDPSMDLETGLWQQWQNRLMYIQKYPMHFIFSEQFRNSPLIKLQRPRDNTMNNVMSVFVSNAIKKEQLRDMPADIYWSLAYGTFYTYIKFHLQAGDVNQISSDSPSLKQLFNCVMDALKVKN